MRHVLLVLALVLAALPPAHAGPRDGTSEKAKQKKGRAHYERGKQLADAGRYVEALVELTAGYELTGRPLFLFNMAECARALKDTVQARELYEKYLAAEPTGPFANAARARLVELTPPPPPQEPVEKPAVVIAPPAETAAAVERHREPPVIATAPAEREESHTTRNVLLVSLGVAIIAGSVAIYMATRGPECGAGCVDLR